MLEALEDEPPARVEFERIRDETVAQMAAWFAQVLDEAVLLTHPALPSELAQVVQVMADGLFLASQAGERPDPDDYARAIVDMVMTEVSALS